MRYINSNAEGDAPATTAPTTPAPAPSVQKSGAMDTVKSLATNKGLLIGSGFGAGIGFLVAWLSGGNKIGTTLAGAGIFGWAGYAMGGEGTHSADGVADLAQGTMSPDSRLYADGKGRRNTQPPPRPSGGGQSRPRPINPTHQSSPRPYHGGGGGKPPYNKGGSGGSVQGKKYECAEFNTANKCIRWREA